MIMCVLLCYPVSIRIYYQQGVLFLVWFDFGFSSKCHMDIYDIFTIKYILNIKVTLYISGLIS